MEVSAAKQHFVASAVQTPVGMIPVVSHEVGAREMLGRWKARWGVGRMDYKVTPGLYAFGRPTSDSPILVTCNYKMTFDFLRGFWKGIDAWVLALDTRGVNVWCAAGKGTFGTAELIKRIGATGLDRVATSREVIVPQLGAPGVDAGEVRKATGFKVVYGPVAATDIPEFLAAGNKATPAMRRVTFTALERLVLAPMELSGARNHLLWILGVALLLSGFGSWGWGVRETLVRGMTLFGAAFLGLLAGAVVTPVLLPWIPGRMFSLKGALVGCALSLGGALAWGRFTPLELVGVTAGATAISSFAAMNFTGSTTFTSQSGVLKEMKLSLPVQAALALTSLVAWGASGFFGGGR